MPFRKKFLLDFQNMPPTSLELAEQVELMRAVEGGVKVRTALSVFGTVSVDTELDRQEAEKAMLIDPIYTLYKNI